MNLTVTHSARRGLRALAAALTAAAAIGAAAPAAAEEARAYAFEVRWSVLPDLVLAGGVIRYQGDSGGYQLGLDASAKLSVPRIDWRGRFATSGEGGPAERSPKRFERLSERPQATERVVVSWTEEDGPPITTTERRPPSALVQRDPVDVSEVVGVVDPLTFVTQILDSVEVSNGESCDVRAKTWDGARLADMESQTFETVKAARTDCRIIYHSIAGLRKDTPWRAREAGTKRIVRFVKKLGKWEPEWVRITGTFLGVQSTFTTTLRRES